MGWFRCVVVFCIGLVCLGCLGAFLLFLVLVSTYMAWSLQYPSGGPNRYYGQREDGAVFRGVIVLYWVVGIAI